MAKSTKVVETPVVETSVILLKGFKLPDVSKYVLENMFLTLGAFEAAILTDPKYKYVVRYSNRNYREALEILGLEPLTVDDPASLWGLVNKYHVELKTRAQKKLKKPKFGEILIRFFQDNKGEETIMVSHEEMLEMGFPVSSVKYTAYWSKNPIREPGNGSNTGSKEMYKYFLSDMTPEGKVWTVDNSDPTEKDEAVDPEGLITFDLKDVSDYAV